jgi:hypothetical protein
MFKLNLNINLNMQSNNDQIMQLHKMDISEFIKNILKMINWKRRGIQSGTQQFHFYIKSYLSNTTVGSPKWLNQVIDFYNEIIELQKKNIAIANPELFSIDISMP